MASSLVARVATPKTIYGRHLRPGTGGSQETLAGARAAGEALPSLIACVRPLALRRQHLKAFARCGFPESLVEADEPVPGRTAVGPDQRGGQLQRVGGTKGMGQQGAAG